MASKLTETMIANAVAGQKQLVLWDTLVTGFGLRILPGGSKTFWFQYRPGGRAVSARMVRIGSWPGVSVNDARKAAKAFAGQVARGDDPAAEKQKDRLAAGSTLRALIAPDGEYERHLKRRHIVNAKVVMSGLRRGLVRLGAKNVADITRKDLVAAITAIEEQGKPGAAQELRKFSHTFLEWCVRGGLARANVLAGYRKPKRSRIEKLAAAKHKPRALSDQEIAAVWHACEGRGSFGGIIRLLLLTGTRRSEIAKLIREQLLPDRLVLPPPVTKMGEHHEVPLTDLMRIVIAAQPMTTGNLVFPSERTGRAVTGWSKLVDVVGNLVEGITA
jgi:hypothetical protein